MSDEDKHLVWNDALAAHKNDKKCGCIWRHAEGYAEGADKTVCHYAMNSFEALSGRTDVYNKNHRAKGIALGYMYPTTMKATKSAKQEVAAAHKKLGKDKDLADFINEFYGKHLGGPLRYLKLDEEGWFVGYKIANSPKTRILKGRQVNFYPHKNETTGGYGKWYPYYHEHHHIFPQGAYRDYVIYGTNEGADDRIKISLTSGWNINHKTNMIMLPEEVMVGRIIELPAHKFYGEFGHSSYSESIAEDLNEVLAKMDEAVEEGKPCELTDIKIELRDMLIAKSQKYYSEILNMGTDTTTDSLGSLIA